MGRVAVEPRMACSGRQRQGTRGRGLGEEEKKRVYAGAKKQARGEEAKAGEQTFRFGYYVFLCIFYFFHISHVSLGVSKKPAARGPL